MTDWQSTYCLLATVNRTVNKGKRAHSTSPKTTQICFIKPFSSRDEKIRTSDLQHPMLARYRATLHPELFKP
jgi:hypothetical protein